jgi:hypothetical protein
MKARSQIIRPSVARGSAAIYALILIASLHTARADTTEREAPAARAWWAFQQRAYPLGHIPAGAQMRALRQMHAARAAATGGAAAADSDRWINIGPAPIVDTRPVSGRVATIAVDPRDLQHWLIGAAQGGIWDTHDAGTTWTPKTDAAASLAMGKIAFAPGAPDIIYAGTGEAVVGASPYGGEGLLKSVDAGATWQRIARIKHPVDVRPEYQTLPAPGRRAKISVSHPYTAVCDSGTPGPVEGLTPSSLSATGTHHRAPVAIYAKSDNQSVSPPEFAAYHVRSGGCEVPAEVLGRRTLLLYEEP